MTFLTKCTAAAVLTLAFVLAAQPALAVEPIRSEPEQDDIGSTPPQGAHDEEAPRMPVQRAARSYDAFHTCPMGQHVLRSVAMLEDNHPIANTVLFTCAERAERN